MSLPLKCDPRILVTRTDRIGDLVLSTPVFRALREKYPKAWIACLTFLENKDIVIGNPYLDEVIVDDRAKTHRGLGFWRLVSLLRRRRFDLAVIFHTKKRTNLLCFIRKTYCFHETLVFFLNFKLCLSLFLSFSLLPHSHYHFHIDYLQYFALGYLYVSR